MTFRVIVSPMQNMKRADAARWLPTLVVVAAALAMLVHGPIAQPPGYHDFADKRSFLGIANAADVLSNAGFAIVAFWGLSLFRAQSVAAGEARNAWILFFASLLLTALGSAYYHLAPDNARIVYDRLPIALTSAGLIAAVRAETREEPQSRWLLPSLALAAIASVLWWASTDRHGVGDLRPYLLLQGAPVVLIPLWQALHRSPRAERALFATAIALFILSKLTEVEDAAIFRALGFMSGHTLKHLLATVAAFLIALDLSRRRITPERPRAST
ncbi:MAG: hypothetical protein ACM3X5_04150 [Bacillota bacterium]